VTGGVVRHPNQDTRHARVHAGCHEKSHAVLDFCVFDIGDGRVSDDSDGESEQHDDTTKLKTIRDESNDD